MEGMLNFVGIIIIVFGILQIILFFKVWGMTNDVDKLTRYFCDKSNNERSIPAAMIEKELEKEPEREYDKKLNSIKPKDRVIRISDGKEMIVDSIENGRFFCKSNFVEGYKWYSKYEIRTSGCDSQSN